MNERGLTPELLERMQADTVWLKDRFFRDIVTLTAQQVAEKAGLAPKDAELVLRDWRDDKRVFSVEENDRVLYPAFQFDEHGQPLQIIEDVLAILGQVKSRSDWDNAFWFAGGNGWLSNGATPLDKLGVDPAAVKHAAEQLVLPDIG